MTQSVSNISLRTAAIVAGIAIVVMAVAAGVANDLTIGSLVVQNDAATTAKNIQNSEALFRLGIYSWFIILVCDVLASWGLYIYLKPVNKNLSLLAAWFRLIYVAILGAAILNYLRILDLFSNHGYLEAFGIEQMQSQVMLFLNGFDAAWSLGLAVFGIHILFLGYLAFKSGYIPKIFGILLLLAFVGYFVTNSANILLLHYEKYKTLLDWIFILPMIAGEVGLALWLLIKGRAVTVNKA